MSYAADTDVSVEKTRAQIETMISKCGADSFGIMADQTRAMIIFRANGRNIRFILPLPDRLDKTFRYSKHSSSKIRYDDSRTYANWEQACRSRWRALYLCIKAKLEAVASGITSFDEEFLAHFVMPNGQNFSEYAVPQIEESSKRGEMPPLMLR